MINQRGNAGIWAIIVLVAVALIVLLVVSDGEGDAVSNTDTASTSEPQSVDNAETVGSSTVAMAISGSGSVVCDFTNEGTTATSYVKDGQIRTVAETGTSTANLLFMDESVYVWQEGSDNGVQFSSGEYEDTFETNGMLPPRPESLSASAADGTATCRAEAVADSRFVLPESVTFQSMGADMMQMNGQVEER